MPTARAVTFRYAGFDIDESDGTLRCRYELDERRFEERITFGPGLDWSHPAAIECARLVAFLAGVSYYKAGAPLVVDLGSAVIRPGEIGFLRSFYIDGLAEYAYRNDIDLDAVEFTGGATPPQSQTRSLSASPGPALIPFGGGIDSIVTVELLRGRTPDSALFVLSRAGDRFAAIEDAAAVTRLPVIRVEREMDEQILRSAELGWLNGHVPVTGILSAIAVLAAVLHGRGSVIMSNEWSASAGNLTQDGREINHQYSKSLAFETGFRSVLAGAIGTSFEYFSLLRPFSELWIARQFAQLPQYHHVFRSCNRAFHQDPDRRATQWCGRCDKCCFIDLMLSPFVSAVELTAVFDGREPLMDASLTGQFRTLLGVSGAPKPFECVGDVRECRAALRLAAARPDRADQAMIRALVSSVGPAEGEAAELLAPMGPHHIPDAFLPTAALG